MKSENSHLRVYDNYSFETVNRFSLFVVISNFAVYFSVEYCISYNVLRKCIHNGVETGNNVTISKIGLNITYITNKTLLFEKKREILKFCLLSTQNFSSTILAWWIDHDDDRDPFGDYFGERHRKHFMDEGVICTGILYVHAYIIPYTIAYIYT